MLSLQIKPIQSGSEAGEYYFSKDNYYFSNELSTAWQGVASQRLNLKGEVTQETLKLMLNGTLPNGEVITKKSATDETKHRGGYDLTFSAPKSLSYLALVCGHTEFIELHNNAVTKVLTLIELHAAEARKQTSDGMLYEKTKNLSFATINHDTSREKDPHLHTHALLMNATERSDGKWRALASDYHQKHGTMEWISKNKIFLGLVYRSEIAMGLKEHGLDIEFTGDAHGLFEIKNFDQNLLDRLSKRRSQIEKQVTSVGYFSQKAYDTATLSSRARKEINDPKVLRESWINESLLCSVDPKTYLNDLKNQTKNEISMDVKPSKEAHNIVEDAIFHLSEKKLQFEYNDILEATLYLSIGKLGLQDLLSALDQKIEDKVLIALDGEKRQFTTHALIEEERHFIQTLAKVKPQSKSIHIAKNTDAVAFQHIIKEALFLRDSIVRIKDDHPTSIHVLKSFIDVMPSDKNIRILTPSRPLANTINEAQDKPKTLRQWLNLINQSELAESIDQFNQAYVHDKTLPFFNSKKEREVLLVDDVQRMNPRQLQQFLDIAAQRKAKVVLIERTLGLQNTKSDVSNLLDKSSIKTFKVHQDIKSCATISINAHRKYEDRLLITSKEYNESGFQPLILTASNKEAMIVNQQVRERLKADGTLSKNDILVKTLQPLFLTESERKQIQHYKEGWVIAKQRGQFEKRFWTIVSVDHEKKQLAVRDKLGFRTTLSLQNIQKNTSIYELRDLAVSKGDKLYTTANIEGLKQGRSVEVQSISSYGIRLRDSKRSYLLELNKYDFMPFNYAYAKSIHQHDKKRYEHIILSMPAYALRKNVLSVVTASAEKSVHILTDDAQRAQHIFNRLQLGTTAIDLAINSFALEKKEGHWETTLDQAISTLTKEKPTLTQSQKAIFSAISQLSEQEAVFSRFNVLAIALQKNLNHTNIDTLVLDIHGLIKNGDLIEIGDHLLTTPKAIKLEKEILNTVKSGNAQFEPLLSPEVSREVFKNKGLTEGQYQSCHLISSTKNQFVMIQGYAGTGKTTMMRTVIDALHESSNPNIQILAVAPTHQAVHEIRNLSIEAQTLKRFLMDQTQASTLNKDTLVLLDESSMVGNQDFFAFTQLVHQGNARCVILGDIAQHQAIESGKPSAMLLKSGVVDVAYMSHVVRQTNEHYKDAVLELIHGDTNQALHKIGRLPFNIIRRDESPAWMKTITHSIVEIYQDDAAIQQFKPEFFDKVKHKNLISAAVDDYLSRTSEVRDNTIIVIHENKAREEANELIRQGLIEKGTLAKESSMFSRLISARFSQEELKQVETYRQCLNEKNEFYLKKDKSYFRLVNMDATTNSIEVMSERGERFSWLPEKFDENSFVELFVAKSSPLAIGDQIHFKKSDPARERYANQPMKVIQFDKNVVTVLGKQGDIHKLDSATLTDAHWDYSYTSTSYAIQGASAKYVIGVEDTYNPQVSHFRSFYITATRGILHAMIYTDSGERLTKRLQIEKDKYSALEEIDAFRKPASSEFKVSTPIHSASRYQEKRLDAGEVCLRLTDNAEFVVETILGSPPNAKLSSKSEYRYGNKGSLSVSMQGEHRGTWFDFETGEKGNLLHLIERTFQLDFKAALNFAANLMGQDISKSHLHRVQPKLKTEKTKETHTKDYAEKLVREAYPIDGTLVEKYLKEHRGIINPNSPNILFHPRVYSRENGNNRYFPALLAVARNKASQVQAVQAIYLDTDTAKKATCDVTKRTFSSISGSAVIIEVGKQADSVTYLAEGVETAFSIRDAVKHERVLAVLGKQNFHSVDPALLTKNVVLCLDNDGKDFRQDKAIQKAIDRLHELGKSVAIAYPAASGDFNDIGRAQGIHSVLKELSYAQQIHPNKKNLFIDIDQTLAHSNVDVAFKKMASMEREI